MVETYSPARLSNRDSLRYIVDGNAATATAIPVGAAVGSQKIVGVQASVLTAPTGATLIADVQINGTTAFTTQANRPTIAIGETVSSKTLPDVVNLDDGDIISVDIDQVGSTVTGAELVVTVEVE